MLATLVLSLSVPFLTPSQDDDLVFDELALRWLQAQKLDQETASRLGWTGVLEQRLAHLSIGLFEVRIPPASLQDSMDVKNLGAAMRSLLALQSTWMRWVETAPGAPAGRDELAPLSRWLEKWSPKTFQGADLAGADLLERLAPPEAREAARRFAQEVRAGKPLGCERELPGAPLVLLPERGEFVEVTSLTGLLDPELRSAAWSSGLTTWLEFDAKGTRLVALQFANPGTRGDYRQGVSVGDRNPAALGEHVTQVACRLLLEQVFDRKLDPALASSMANDLVIEIFGELDTRIDGDVRSRSTQGRSTFVPGGNPNGGFLPPTSAETRWRGTKGKDHFQGVLLQVQKQGGKKASSPAERIASFPLQSDDGSAQFVARAPFLGPAGAPPPAEFLGDYLEFLRAYGVGFMHWLRTEGGGKRTEAAPSFAALLRGLARGVKSEELPGLFQDVYGIPLSSATTDALLEPPTLEGRFLAWLSKR